MLLEGLPFLRTMRIQLKVFKQRLSVEKSSTSHSTVNIFSLASYSNYLSERGQESLGNIRTETSINKAHALAVWHHFRVQKFSLLINLSRLRNGINLTGTLKKERNTFLLVYISQSQFSSPLISLKKWLYARSNGETTPSQVTEVSSFISYLFARFLVILRLLLSLIVL